MKFKVLMVGCVAAAAMMAQPPGGMGNGGMGNGGMGGGGMAGGGMGQRGRGMMGFGPGGPGGGAGAQQTVTGAPYSGVEVHSFQQALANGNVIQHQQTTNVFRDALGRVRRETTSTTPEGKTVTRVSITDPVAGVVRELDTTQKIAFERPLRQGGPGRGAGRGPNGGAGTQGAGAGGGPARPRGQASAAGPGPAADPNTKRETLSAQSINGFLASGSRVTRTIPAGQIGNTQAIQTVHETWMIDDLKVPVQTKMSDPRNGTTTMQLTNVQRTAPDASLFTVPADYTVKKGGPGGGMGRGMGGMGMGRGPKAPGGPVIKQ